MLEERMKWELDALKERSLEYKKEVEAKFIDLRKEIREGDERTCKDAKEDLQRVENELKKDLDSVGKDVSSIKETTEEIKQMISEGNGMVKAAKWAGGVIAFAVTALFGWLKLK